MKTMKLLAACAAMGAALSVRGDNNPFADSDPGSYRPILTHVASPREVVDLSGAWELTTATNTMVAFTNHEGKLAWMPVEPGIEKAIANGRVRRGKGVWEKIVIPSAFASGKGDKADCYVRRFIDVKPEWAGKRLKLHFEQVCQSHTVYVNRKDASGFIRSFSLPNDVDITDFVHSGTNEIIVQVRQDGYRTKWVEYSDWRPGWGGGAQGIRRPVHLEVMDKVYIADVIQRCTVSNRIFAADVVVANDTDKEESVTVTAEVVANWKTAPQTVTVPARGRVTAHFEVAWPNVRLWTPDDPQLYFCDVRIKGRDAFRRRFGFCEVTVEGPDLKLNGRKVMLRRGSAPEMKTRAESIACFRANRANGATGARVWSDWERVCELADEFGYLITPVASQGWGAAPRDQQKFWPNYGKHLTEFVRALRHHPSVLYWCASNEFGSLYGGDAGTTNETPVVKRQVATIKGAIEVEDRAQGRPWECCGEAELGVPVRGGEGEMPIRSFHYPVAYNADRNALPEAAYWYEKGDPLPWQRIVKKTKPLSISEDLYHGLVDEFFGMTRFGGDAVFTRDGYAKSLKWAGDTIAEGLYAGGVTTWEPWTFRPDEKYNRLYRAEAIQPDYLVALRDFNRSLRSGEDEARVLYCYNKTFTDTKLNLERLFKIDGRIYFCTNETVKLDAGAKVALRQHIRVPEVKVPTTLTIDMTLRDTWKGPGPEGSVYRRTYEFTVYPRTVVLDAGEGCALVAPTDSLLAKAVRWDEGVFADASSAIDSGADRIVVNGTISAADARLYDAFVRKGGKVLALELNSDSWAPANLAFGRPVPFVFRRNDERMTDLKADRLGVWRGDSLVGESSYTKTEEDCEILWDCGYNEGMSSFLVGWVYRAKGAWMVCQLPVVSRFSSEPSAPTVLKSVLAEFATGGKVPEDDAFVPADDELRPFCDRAGIRLAEEASDADVYAITAGTNGFGAAQREVFERAVRKEKTVFVFGVRPGNLDEILARYGLKAELPYVWGYWPENQGKTGVDTGVMWFCRRDNRGFLRGLSNDDFFWRGNQRMDIWGSWACDNQRFRFECKKQLEMHEAWCVFTREHDSPAEIVTDPGVMAVVPNGEGWIVFSSAKLVEHEQQYPDKAHRVLRTLLVNAGASTSVPPPVKELTPVSIVGSFNRALWNDPLNRRADGTYDPVGWFGDENDMRYFPVNLCGWSVHSGNFCPKQFLPTVPQRMGPVNFRLELEHPDKTGSKGCVVVDPGETVRIRLPKGTKANALWFLGACSHSKDNTAVNLRFNGRGEPIVMKRGEQFNSFRWGSLPKKGHVGWTGYTPSDPSAAQYVWQIVNPRPGEEIDFIEITSPLEKGWHDRWGNKSSLAIVAVTVEN